MAVIGQSHLLWRSQVPDHISHTRPKLVYSSSIWNPQHETPVKKIEQVQRNAARFVLNKPYNRQNPTSADTDTEYLFHVIYI